MSIILLRQVVNKKARSRAIEAVVRNFRDVVPVQGSIDADTSEFSNMFLHKSVGNFFMFVFDYTTAEGLVFWANMSENGNVVMTTALQMHEEI